MIDSELVPWGKGEKQAGEADEIVSETICLQGVEVRLTFCANKRINNQNIGGQKVGRMMACLLKNEPTS